MINHHMRAALARERRDTLLAEAEDVRRARQFRQSPGRRVMLRDGSQVLIRPVQGADAPLLVDGFARLSATGRWMRFLTSKKELSPAELRYFTDVDHHDHEALGALRRDGRGVGIARYIRQADDPCAADIAVTIVDAWQGRGLGTELLAQLSDRARQEGIHRFTALVASENVAVAGLLRSMRASLVRRESNTLEYEIPLAPGEEQDPVRDGTAYLEVLAAQMRARGWTAYISAPAGRLVSLIVQDPGDEHAHGSDIIAAHGGTADDWWYWFSWAERIAPVHAPEAAAEAVISALQRPRALS
jgi:RimJ/RimL family protein N-acetyltransferase